MGQTVIHYHLAALSPTAIRTEANSKLHALGAYVAALRHMNPYPLGGTTPYTLLTTRLGSYLLSTDTRIASPMSLLRTNARCFDHVSLEEGSMKATTLPEQPDVKSPAGADVRFLMEGETGTMIHCTVPPHQTNRAVLHATVSEFWYVLEGHGEIWRDDGLESCVTTLVPDTSIDIPVGTAFQYRSVSNFDLKFICITMPPWPGDSEATYVGGKWQPTV